jgi:(p)ppGpp synthase/HD superfamily hydrolase
MKQEDIIQEAQNLAKKFHKGQKQANKDPYFEHTQKVASLLKKWKQDNEVIAAGYLHDVVEDTNVKLSHIKQKFGKRVGMLVDGASFIKKRVNGKYVKDWDLTYKKFSKIAIKDPALVLIKAADMQSNIENICEYNKNFIIKESGSRYRRFWIPFIKEVGFKDIGNKVDKKINKYTKEKPKIILYDYISKKELNEIKKRLK